MVRLLSLFCCTIFPFSFRLRFSLLLSSTNSHTFLSSTQSRSFAVKSTTTCITDRSFVCAHTSRSHSRPLHSFAFSQASERLTAVVDCSHSDERSSSMGPQRHGESVPEIDLISGDFTFKPRPSSKADVLHDEDLSDNEPTYPTAFYLKHAHEVNRTPIPNLYAPSTEAQFAKVEILWRQYVPIPLMYMWRRC
jgi:hypothetical protein